MAAMDTTKTSFRARAALAAAIALIGLVGAARARAEPDPVDLAVVDRDTGRELPVWRHDGRLFVAGKPGHRYGLRVTNNTDRRVLVVMSVDGVNILTGETAGWDQRGYIFGPHDTYDLNGWRKSLSEVADFAFARLPQSYAALTGRPENVGVIGIAMFGEKVEAVAAEPATPPPPPGEADRDAGNSGSAAGRAVAPPRLAQVAPAPATVPAPGAGDVSEMVVTAERREEKLGTGHGAREHSVMTIEPFERATPYPELTREIEYDTYDNLVAMGVIPPHRYGERRPRPFPSSPDGAGFVPDPPGDP